LWSRRKRLLHKKDRVSAIFRYHNPKDYGGQRAFAPFFGVEVNAGYGPDQIKFYIGSIIRLRGLNF